MTKNPHAVALGRKGGTARAKALTPQQRQAIARQGGLTWQQKRRSAMHLVAKIDKPVGPGV